jgi:hypothetical protein
VNAATAKKWFAIFGRFLIALSGSAVCLLVSAVFISMIDSWAATGLFALPFLPLDKPLLGLGYLALAGLMATTVLLAIVSIPLILLKRESLVAYLALSGGLPLVLLALPATEGDVFVLACAAMIASGFWWFSYRRSRTSEAVGPALVRSTWLALLIGMIAFAGMYWSEYRTEQIAAAERERTMMEPAPLGGAVLGNEALLYDFRGRLFSYDRRSGKRHLLLNDGVADVSTAGDGSAWILSVPSLPEDLEYNAALPPGSFTLSQYRNGQIEALPPVEYAANERPLMLAIRDGEPVLIGRTAAFIKAGGGTDWQKVEFDRTIGEQLRDGDASTLISSDGKIAFVGINLGEWGGGLVKVDLANGKVNRPDKRGPDLCDGPLNSDCDPVTGIVPDPDDNRCVLASIGLSHFLMHGRVLRVCPESISVELTRPLERPTQIIERSIRGAATGDSNSPMSTEAFFALIETGDGSIWAISPFAAYRKEGAKWSRHALPDLKQRGSLEVSEELPGIVLLSSWRNARNSLSGPTPMAFPAN